MSSSVPEPTPDPSIADAWFQRPPFLATCALVVVLVGSALWFLGRESDADTVAIVPAETDADVSITDGGANSTASVAPNAPGVETTPTTLVNPFGDLAGAPVTEPASAPAQFATALQRGADPATVTVLHTPAYYYALWWRLSERSADPEAPPFATANGYAVATNTGSVELIELSPAEGPIRDGTEVRAGVPTPFAQGVQITGLCAPDREPQCDLSGANFAPDARGSDAQMWALAKVVLDPEHDTWLLYVDLRERTIQSAEVVGATHVGVDRALSIVAITYPKEPPPQTVLTLVASADDGTVAAFDFAVS